MGTSVWPREYLGEPHEIHREHGNHLIIFLVSPFSPSERYDELLAFCRSVCSEVGREIGAKVECVRADLIPNPNMIHQDIWDHIQMSDAIIVDVSDRNGNVMMELGVAASLRDKDNVVLIRDEESEEDFLFDISPVRHLTYQRSLSGDMTFRGRLKYALKFSLAPAPYVPKELPAVELPLDIELTQAMDNSLLLSPSNSHRRLLSDGLEFGSFYVFRYSWMTVGQERFGNIRVQAEMRFTELKPDVNIGQGWMGIMLRSQHFYAEFGHLLYVTSDGTVRHTQPVSEFEKSEDDPFLGRIESFEFNRWVQFDVRFDEDALVGSVGSVKFSVQTADMPYRYNAGLVRFQTSMARACLKALKIEVPAFGTDAA